MTDPADTPPNEQALLITRVARAALVLSALAIGAGLLDLVRSALLPGKIAVPAAASDAWHGAQTIASFDGLVVLAALVLLAASFFMLRRKKWALIIFLGMLGLGVAASAYFAYLFSKLLWRLLSETTQLNGKLQFFIDLVGGVALSGLAFFSLAIGAALALLIGKLSSPGVRRDFS